MPPKEEPKTKKRTCFVAKRKVLKKTAVPSQNLPKSSTHDVKAARLQQLSAEGQQRRMQRSTSEVHEGPSFTPEEEDAARALAELLSEAHAKVDKAVQAKSGALVHRFVDTLDDSNVNSFTGLPSMEFLKRLVTAYKKVQLVRAHSRITAEDRVVLTLIKLKHNVCNTFLKDLFCCSLTSCSETIEQTTLVLSAILSSVISLPLKEEVLENTPQHFRHFPNVVVGCIEIPVSQPNRLTCALRCYSTYKKEFTCKYMVSVTPEGVIAQVSQGYGGRSSDIAMFEQSGLLELLDPVSDAVMADRGFLIDDCCAERLVGLVRPPFEKSRQLSGCDAVRTQEIASASVHFGRVIQRMKAFKILTTRVPWKLASRLDQIVTIIAGITNLSAPVLASHEFT
ncbi:uncharacterized protein LOC144138436 isoform X2 [Haemaphysalis longicornis]